MKPQRIGKSRFGVKISNAEIVKKMRILQIEKGISINGFIIQAIAEKLRKLGYRIK